MRLANAIRLLPCVALLIAGAPAARADQVHTDPNSPTSKEYAIPLDSARHAAASGGSGSVSSQSSSSSSSATTSTTPAAPLFGVGVGSSGSGNASKKRAKHHTRHHKTTAKHNADTMPAGNSTPPNPPSHLVNATSTPGGGLTTPVLIGGLAAVALLLGGVGGLALRRRVA